MIEHWLEHPEQMGAEAVEKLPQLIDQCPYCATYRMLLCIALANTHSTHLKEEIEKEQKGEYQAQYRIITSGKNKKYGRWQKASRWKKLRS